MSSPRVSVIIPARNREKYLPTAIDSVLAQTLADFELIVVDDGSADKTPEIIQQYESQDHRVRWVRNETSLGIPGARNRGISEARGEYCASLDSDDYAYPQRLARQVDFLDRHPDHAVVGSWSIWMQANGRLKRKVRRRPINPDDAVARLIFNSSLTQSSVMARTRVLRENLYDERFVMSSDYELWARLAMHHRLVNLPEVLVCQREHAQRTTRERAGRIVESQHAIYRAQFKRLGVEYTEQDVDRHHVLPRSYHKEGTATAEYLDWAADWLNRLSQANANNGYFPAPAFERVLGWAWAAACMRSVLGNHPTKAIRRFVGSPWFAPAVGALTRQTALECRNGGPLLARRLATQGLSVKANPTAI